MGDEYKRFVSSVQCDYARIPILILWYDDKTIKEYAEALETKIQ